VTHAVISDREDDHEDRPVKISPSKRSLNAENPRGRSTAWENRWLDGAMQSGRYCAREIGRVGGEYLKQHQPGRELQWITGYRPPRLT